jgi:hypothetical protein
VVTVPAWVWRFGPVLRAVIVGVVAGAFFGALAWIDSGFLLAAAIVFAVLGIGFGASMGWRMTRYWPGAARLDGDRRSAVAAAARRGASLPGLEGAVAEYRDGLYAASRHLCPFRFLLVAVFLVAAALAIYDAVRGSTRDTVSSVVYLGVVGVEVFWWAGRHDRLLDNADQAAAQAARAEEIDD